GDIDVEGASPIILVAFENASGMHITGDIDQNIDSPDTLCKGGDGLTVADIEAARLDRRRQGEWRPAGRYHRRALGGEGQRDGAADTGAGAGNDGGFAFKAQSGHEVSV